MMRMGIDRRILAKAAYEAYVSALQVADRTDTTVYPSFEYLPFAQRRAWEASALTAASKAMAHGL